MQIHVSSFPPSPSTAIIYSLYIGQDQISNQICSDGANRLWQLQIEQDNIYKANVSERQRQQEKSVSE